MYRLISYVSFILNIPFLKYVIDRNAYENFFHTINTKFQNKNLTGIKIHMYWIKKMWYMFTMNFYSVLKRKIFIYKKMKLKIIMLKKTDSK